MLGIGLSCRWIKPDYSRTLESSFRTLFPHFRYVFAGQTDLYFILLKRNHDMRSLFNKDYFRFWNTDSQYSFALSDFFGIVWTWKLNFTKCNSLLSQHNNILFRPYIVKGGTEIKWYPFRFYWAVFTVDLRLLIRPTHSSHRSITLGTCIELYQVILEYIVSSIF